MQYLNDKSRLPSAVEHVATPGPSITLLAMQLLRALLIVCWRRAQRVLSVGDCSVH